MAFATPQKSKLAKQAYVVGFSRSFFKAKLLSDRMGAGKTSEAKFLSEQSERVKRSFCKTSL